MCRGNLTHGDHHHHQRHLRRHEEDSHGEMVNPTLPILTLHVATLARSESAGIVVHQPPQSSLCVAPPSTPVSCVMHIPSVILVGMIESMIRQDAVVVTHVVLFHCAVNASQPLTWVSFHTHLASVHMYTLLLNWYFIQVVEYCDDGSTRTIY